MADFPDNVINGVTSADIENVAQRPFIISQRAPVSLDKGTDGQFWIYINENGENKVFQRVNNEWKKIVFTDRTIADISLADNITVTELQTALSVYPVLTNMYEPPTKFEGEVGQLCVGYVMTENPKLYMCFGKNAAGEYIWQLIGGGSGETDLSGYVPTTRTIADIDLSDDITAEELQTALETYPVIIKQTEVGKYDIGERGQFAVNAFYKGNPKLHICQGKTETGNIDNPYEYVWEEVGSANISFREINRPVDTYFVGDVGDIVKTSYTNPPTIYICTDANEAPPKYTWQQLSNNGLVPFEFKNNAEINSNYKGNQGQIVINYENGKFNIYMCVATNTEPEEYTWVKLNEDTATMRTFDEYPNAQTEGKLNEVAIAQINKEYGGAIFASDILVQCSHIASGDEGQKFYLWKELGYVPTNRIIADIPLTDDISVEALQNALGFENKADKSYVDELFNSIVNGNEVAY